MEWIKTSDQAPPEGVLILAYESSGWIGVARRENIYLADSGGTVEVSKWMLLEDIKPEEE